MLIFELLPKEMIKDVAKGSNMFITYLFILTKKLERFKRANNRELFT
jgi:hypothetical protein